MKTSTEYRRIAANGCGSASSNVTVINVEDTEDPVFTGCPSDIQATTDQGKKTARVNTPAPAVSDNCGIKLQTWTLTGATTGKSGGNGINRLGTYDFNIGLTTVTYLVEDGKGNSASCSFKVDVKQGNPPISGISIPNTSMKVGDRVTATIELRENAGSQLGLASGTIGGYPLSPSSFTRQDARIYRVEFTITEGGNNYPAGADIPVSGVVLSNGTGMSAPYNGFISQPADPVDASRPVIESARVQDLEVGVGGEVLVTISADESGYEAVSGTSVNGIPLESPRVEFHEIGDGEYQLSYTVGSGDSEFPPGGLQLNMVLSDAAGNRNAPYTRVEDNTLEVYMEPPTARLQGTGAFCEGEEAVLEVIMTGRSPWSIELTDGYSNREFKGILESPYEITMEAGTGTTFSITRIADRNGVENEGSGELQVSIQPKTEVEIINLTSGYHMETEPFLLEANVMGGVFSGPGVNTSTGYFDPGMADTLNSPHTIIYTYVNEFGCTSTDTAIVTVHNRNNKISILEHFTNSADEASLSADTEVDRFASHNRRNVLDLQYHMNYPDFDPMNFNNPGPASTRAGSLGVGQVPYAILNGGYAADHRYDFSSPERIPKDEHLRRIALEKPDFMLDLTVDWLDGGLDATTGITCLTDTFSGNFQLYIAVFETMVTSYRGINGDSAFRNVVLDMLPSPAGTLLKSDWSEDKQEILYQNWEYAPYLEDVDELGVVAFIQDRNSGRILQSDVSYRTPQVGIFSRESAEEDLQVYPNPAGDLVFVTLG
ncbi:MAG: HYR domain-containing protein, partial [Bacteroidetes bacterium]